MLTLFTVLITVQFVVVALHDLIDIPGWTYGRQMRAAIGRNKLWLVTLANSIFPGLAVALAFYYWNKPVPRFAWNYWIIYCAITVGAAVAMWYVPYFFGATAKQKTDYAQMYEGTRQILAPRGDNPRPNLLHVCFHLLFVANLLFIVILRFRSV